MDKIFVSHASEDQPVVAQIADALHHAGVNTWVSFRDITPGAHWDEAIEVALRSAAALIVVVSSASIESRYVRAEVEEAISANMTVVPVVVDDVALPLRWRTLQHIRWNTDGSESVASTIADVLPERAIAKFAAALSNEAEFENLTRLVLSHPEWLPMESHMSQWYSFRIQPEIAAKSTVDCFAARLDTPGPRAILVYLASPYERPFSASGGARPHFRKTLSKLRVHTEFLRRDMPGTHPLAPPTLFAAEAHGWKHILPRYTGFRAYIIAGRRSHYQGAALNARNSHVAKVSAELYSYDRNRMSTFEVLSYDRLLEAAAVAEARASGA